MSTINLAKQYGQSMSEYLVVLFFSVVVLIVGGNSSVMQQVMSAIKGFFKAYAYAMSVVPI